MSEVAVEFTDDDLKKLLKDTHTVSVLAADVLRLRGWLRAIIADYGNANKGHLDAKVAAVKALRGDDPPEGGK